MAFGSKLDMFADETSQRGDVAVRAADYVLKALKHANWWSLTANDVSAPSVGRNSGSAHHNGAY